MIDRGKVIVGLEHCNDSTSPCESCPYNEMGLFCDRKLIDDAIALLKEQEPRVLTLEEVKAIAVWEAKRTLSSEVKPVWLEQNEDGLTNLSLVLISWWYIEGIDKDEAKFEFIANYFGTYIDDTLNYLDYGTRWRTWSSKPTIEQRKAVKWNDESGSH